MRQKKTLKYNNNIYVYYIYYICVYIKVVIFGAFTGSM